MSRISWARALLGSRAMRFHVLLVAVLVVPACARGSDATFGEGEDAASGGGGSAGAGGTGGAPSTGGSPAAGGGGAGGGGGDGMAGASSSSAGGGGAGQGGGGGGSGGAGGGVQVEVCQEPSLGCAHSVCDEGAALDATCSDCADKNCFFNPECCTQAWDAFCVSEAIFWCDCNCPP